MTKSNVVSGKNQSFYKSYFSMTLVIALQNLVVYSVSLADNVMLGGYSELALSGVALCNQIQYFLQMTVMGIGAAMVVLASQFWGKKDTQSVQKIIAVGFWVAVAVSMLLWCAAFFFPHGCLGLLTDDQEVIGEGVKYLKIICFTYVFFGMTNTLLAGLRSVETVRIGFLVSGSTLVINVCLNYLLIYGNFGAPRLGSQGAAIATLTSRIVEFGIICFYLKAVDRKIRFQFRSLFRLGREILKKFLRVGSPVIGGDAMWGIAQGAQTAIIGRLGASAIAANSISTTVIQVLTVIIHGSANATGVMTGKWIGAGKIEELKRYAKRLQLVFLALGLVTGVTLYLVKDFILGFYAITPETKTMAVHFIIILCITTVGTGYQLNVLTGFVRGGGDTTFVLINDSIFMWLIVLPASALAAFVFHASPEVVFLCLKSDQILKCFVALVKVNRWKWIRVLTQ